MNELTKLHDKTFRAAMSYKQVAREFFHLHLPQALQQVVDFDSLCLCADTHVDKDLQLQATDMLYSVTIKGQPNYVNILCEHQSSPDKWMPVRIMRYVLAIMVRHRQQYPHTNGVPLVFPLVFYHGKRPYRYSTAVKDLILGPKILAEMNLFKDFLLINVHQLDDEVLMQYPWAGLMQFIFKHIHAEDFLPHLQDSLKLWQQVEREGGKEYILMLATYISKAAKSKAGAAVLNLLSKHLTKPTGKKIMTIAEQIRQDSLKKGIQRGMKKGMQEGIQKGMQKGMQEGLQKGLKKGMQKGMQQGEAAILLRLLSRKFGAISTDYLQRINQADADTLLIWSDKILDADDLQEVFH